MFMRMKIGVDFLCLHGLRHLDSLRAVVSSYWTPWLAPLSGQHSCGQSSPLEPRLKMMKQAGMYDIF